MKVSGIFKTLIVVVICVIIGAFLINILMPNVTTTLIDSVEDQIFNATGLSFDFNNNGNAGNNAYSYTGDRAGATDDINDEDTVTGFN